MALGPWPCVERRRRDTAATLSRDAVGASRRRLHEDPGKFKFIFHAESLTWPKLRLCTFLWNFISPQKMLKALVGSEPLDRMKTSGVKLDESL